MLAQFFAGKDNDAHVAEDRITGSVIAMDVCIRHKTNRLSADLPDRRQQLLGDLGVLSVDHEDAVRAREHTDEAAGRIRMVHIDIG